MKRRFLLCCLTLFVGLADVQAQLVLGNPSGAKTDVGRANNYLLIHNGFIMSYNRSRGAANWVAWHLSATDLGDIERASGFRQDTALPAAWRIKDSDYDGVGFDRGHMRPSEDRSNTEEANRETFIMSNAQPQTVRLNRGPWKALEGEIQDLVRQGFEAYIYAGCYGGTDRIAEKVTLPTRCWKVAVLLNEGANDRGRINVSTRVIAVDLPNSSDAESGWRNHRVSVDDIEDATGYNLLSRIRNDIESVIEAKIDDQ